MEMQPLLLCKVTTVALCVSVMDIRVWRDCVSNFHWLIITLAKIHWRYIETGSIKRDNEQFNSSRLERIKLNVSLDEEGVKRSLEIGHQDKRMCGRSKETLSVSGGGVGIEVVGWLKLRFKREHWRGASRTPARGVVGSQRKNWECQGGCKDTSQEANDCSAM